MPYPPSYVKTGAIQGLQQPCLAGKDPLFAVSGIALRVSKRTNETLKTIPKWINPQPG